MKDQSSAGTDPGAVTPGLARALAVCLLAFPVFVGEASDRKSAPASGSLQAKAEAGDATAQFCLAAAHDSGRGATRDGAAAVRWYTAAAEQALAAAQNSLGSVLQAEERYEEARGWFERASAQGDADATNSLAYLHDAGLGGFAQDRMAANTLYLRAADLGSSWAMFNLAVQHGGGQLGAPPDFRQACVWTARAARYRLPADRELQTQIAGSERALATKLSRAERATCRRDAADWRPAAVAQASVAPACAGR